jgi:hypothetical protein
MSDDYDDLDRLYLLQHRETFAIFRTNAGVPFFFLQEEAEIYSIRNKLSDDYRISPTPLLTVIAVAKHFCGGRCYSMDRREADEQIAKG